MSEKQLRIETVWSCPVCGESAMGLYEGPDDPVKVIAWVQEAHNKMNSDCPYKFKNIEAQPMREEPKE